MIFGKVWGTTKSLIVTPFIEVHELSILPNSFCSVHKHNFKWNAFYVIDGELTIEVHKNDYSLTDAVNLKHGDFTSVKPGEYHQFLNKTDYLVRALEFYYPEPLSEDIIRKTVGGIKGE